MKSAILTIDDVSSKNTPAIVDYLVKKNITALMFAVGENIEKYYDEALYALRAGMILGNHSYSHPHFSSISFEEAVEEIEKNEIVLDKLYTDAQVERIYRPFRFPFGDKGGENATKLQNYFTKRGFHKLVDTDITYPWWRKDGNNKNIDTFWTFNYEEYNIRPNSTFTKEDVIKKINDLNPPNEGILLAEDTKNILLLHAHDETEEILPKYYELFIDLTLENGVIFDTPRFF